MCRAFHLLDQLAYIIEGKPRLEIAEVTHLYPERPALQSDAPARKPSTQRLIDNFAERSACAPRFRLELCCHIIVKG
jgi:hypothetical protein